MHGLRIAGCFLVVAGIILVAAGLGQEDLRECGEGRAPEASCAAGSGGAGVIVLGALLAFVGVSWLVASRGPARGWHART